MKKTFFLLLIAILSSIGYSNAQQWNSVEDSLSSKQDLEFIDDDLIVAALDSLSNLKYFENSEYAMQDLSCNKYNFLPNFIPSYHDSVYFYRVQQLDANSPIDLSYNQIVKSFIELYANKRRGTTSRVLGLSQIYFPLFEHYLDQFNLPLELKYLAIVESALNPEAKSRVGATGLWQFMYNTGKVYGLEVSSYVDDRNDPIKATIAACRHFTDLYNMYHDWLLVLAAYNSGPGNVNKAIRRSGGKMNFWEIRPYLPRETRDYVPAFIAVNYIMNFSQEHNLYPVTPRTTFHETDTVIVTQPLAFSAVSQKLNIPVDELRFLNPTFRKNYIPATPQKPFIFRLPIANIGDFVTNEDALYAFNKLKAYEPPVAASSDNVEYEIITKKVYHKVRKGESIGSIAKKYGCTTSEIKKWNRLRKAAVYQGQKLAIYVKTKRPIPDNNNQTPVSNPQADNNVQVADADTTDNTPAAVPSVKKPATPSKSVGTPQYHTVKKGEYLAKIAQKYNVSLNDLREWNNLSNNVVFVGQKIRVNSPDHASKVTPADSAVAHNKPVDKPAAKPSPKGKQVYYTVQSGDTLWSIAQKYKGVTVSQIRQWNNLSSKQTLKVGQKIKVVLPAS
jgi:membrane-bound lytic murein transglycosylase D